VASTPPKRPAPLVVVAEDDKLSRERVVALLKRHGLRVEPVENGKQALERVSKGGVDLVMLDVVMPGLDGLETCRLLKGISQESFLPVVLLTSRNDVESRVEGLRIGADDYVTKPFDERELVARVEAMLRIKRAHDDVADARKRLEELSVQDELTGLYNFRYLHTRLAEEFKRAERYRDPLACAMLDVDGLGKVNEQHGPEAGDQALRQVGARVRAVLREVDVLARYGGDELLAVLPSTHFSGALAAADRMWRAVGASPVDVGAASAALTVSIGIALYPSRDIRTKDELLASTEAALAEAKRGGRDRICVFQTQGYIYRPA